MTLHFLGIHHLTAVSSDIKENKKFYTQTLGLRLVKKTVNQDDVSAYHLFYADKNASPGSDITFFDFNVEKEVRGNNSITRTSLRVPSLASLEYWQQRFAELNVFHDQIKERDLRLYLDFEDFEGQRLSLVVDENPKEKFIADEKSTVPLEHQIMGLGPIVMSVPKLAPSERIIQKVLNMNQVREYACPENPKDSVFVYQMGEGGVHAELHVAVRSDLPFYKPGAGGVHHVAFRTPDENEYEQWYERLKSLGIISSGKINRFYFKSQYLREPNGILFEIATDGPGFAVDENIDSLGENLSLPPFLESRRSEIAANLKPLD